jgi:LysR family glycine cleavage system transcriptional activator
MALARHLARGLAIFRDGVDAAIGVNGRKPVQVTMSPGFAAWWLMPRINHFQQRHPKINLMLNPTAEVIDLASTGIDLAIRFGKGNWLGLKVTPLLSPNMVVVGTPKLIGRRARGGLAKLAELPWLQELGTDEVAEWMKRRGIVPHRTPKVTQMPGTLIMEAVRRGDGLTYTARCFVDEYIRSGQLIEIFSERNVGGYHIVTRPGAIRAPVRTFISWLQGQTKIATARRE